MAIEKKEVAGGGRKYCSFRQCAMNFEAVR